MSFVRLEYQKNNLKPYLYSMLGLLLFILVTVIIMAVVGTSMMPKVLEPLNIFKNKESFMLLSQILIQSCFAVFSAVLFSKIIIEDYRANQVVLLFSYPISRGRIIGGKIMFVSIWTVTATFFSTVICLGTLKFCSDYIPLLKGSDLLFGWESILTKGVVSGVIALMIGGISLAVGFKNKSVIATIISSLIICSVLSNILQLEKEGLNSIIYGLLLAVSIGAVTTVVNKTKQMEVG